MPDKMFGSDSSHPQSHEESSSSTFQDFKYCSLWVHDAFKVQLKPPVI